jgi:hypothetical protein
MLEQHLEPAGDGPELRAAMSAIADRLTAALQQS